MAGTPTAPSLVADVGGTNIRLALVQDVTTLEKTTNLRCSDYPDLASAIRTYLEDAGLILPPSRAAIAVASPIAGDHVELTNNGWAFSIAELQLEFAFTSLSVINDFTALAMAIPRLIGEDLQKIGGGAPVQNAPIAVIGPGTGLGVSGLVPSGDNWIVLASEGGHATLAPRNSREWDVTAELARRFGHVSFERAVSGPGLVNLHTALTSLDGAPGGSLTPDQIAEAGLDGTDSSCVEALEIFCAMLGTVAGNLALTLGSLGGVYIGGGIVPRLGKFLTTSQFRARFEDKGRFRGYVEAIPSYVITRDNPALIGLVQQLRADSSG